MAMINDVKVKKLNVIPDERGRLTEILRGDDQEFFTKFGQVYCSVTYPNVVKAWHYHKVQVDNFVCVSGMVKLVLYDSREDSSTYGEINEFYLGVHNPVLVRVPNLVYHGWMCVSTEEAIVINCPTEVYNYQEPDEFRMAPHDGGIPYDWKRKDR
jgi:dTDP-4-dehydrorhamnose 3,5-epimerase